MSGTITTDLVELINRGRAGLNQGLSMGMPKLESVMDGLTKSTYSLIFSGTGVGKTSFALYAYIYRPLMDNFESDDFKVIYFSLEMSKEILLAKLLSMYIYETHGIELSFKEIFSRSKGQLLSDENYKIILSCTDWLAKVEKKFKIYDGSLNASKYYAILISELEKEGSFVSTGESSTIYRPKNKDLTTLVVLDHFSLVRAAEGRSKKEEIDKISSYAVSLRNKCGISPLMIMQTNRDQTSMERRKGGFDTPQLSDIKDSGSPSEDAEVIIALFSPFHEKKKDHKGYDIVQLQDSFRAIFVLKNRYGNSQYEIGSGFYGRCGIWKEFPKSNEITDYTKLLRLPKFLK